MSKLEYIDTIDLPTHAASYLVNGDSSSLSDEDIEIIDDWTNDLDYNCLVFDFGKVAQDGYFSTRPEFGLPCDCEKVMLYGHKKS